MKLGTSIPKFYQADGLPDYEKIYELARLTEDAGFYYGSLPHHSFTPGHEDYGAPQIMLAALAARTSTLRLATTIFILPLHNPVAIAEQLGELDCLSNGRLIFGAAIGYRAYEYEGFGVDFHTRGRRMDECLQIIRGGFATGHYEFSGEFFNVPRTIVSPMPMQRPGPPIWIGGTADAALRRAAKLGDGWISENLLLLDAVKDRIAIYNRFADEAGCPRGTTTIPRNASVAATRSEIEDNWLPSMIKYQLFNRANYAKAGMEMADPSGILAKLEAGESVEFSDFIHERVIAGTPEDCILQIKLWQDKTGCDYLHLILNTQLRSEAEYEGHKKMLSLFRDEIMPAI